MLARKAKHVLGLHLLGILEIPNNLQIDRRLLWFPENYLLSLYIVTYKKRMPAACSHCRPGACCALAKVIAFVSLPVVSFAWGAGQLAW